MKISKVNPPTLIKILNIFFMYFEKKISDINMKIIFIFSKCQVFCLFSIDIYIYKFLIRLAYKFLNRFQNMIQINLMTYILILH